MSIIRESELVGLLDDVEEFVRERAGWWLKAHGDMAEVGRLMEVEDLFHEAVDSHVRASGVVELDIAVIRHVARLHAVDVAKQWIAEHDPGWLKPIIGTDAEIDYKWDAANVDYLHIILN